MIRYHLSLNHELCHLETGGGVTSLNDSFSAFWEIIIGAPGRGEYNSNAKT